MTYTQRKEDFIMAIIHLTQDGFDKATANGISMVDFWAS